MSAVKLASTHCDISLSMLWLVKIDWYIIEISITKTYSEQIQINLLFEYDTSQSNKPDHSHNHSILMKTFHANHKIKHKLNIDAINHLV